MQPYLAEKLIGVHRRGGPFLRHSSFGEIVTGWPQQIAQFCSSFSLEGHHDIFRQGLSEESASEALHSRHYHIRRVTVVVVVSVLVEGLGVGLGFLQPHPKSTAVSAP